MLDLLVQLGLTDEQARRMLLVARDYGLVNFPHEGELFGLKYESGEYTLGDADFSNVGR